MNGQELVPKAATLITRHGQGLSGTTEHAFVLWGWILPCTVVPSGFSSGYHGEGPRGLALALLMLRAKNIDVFELEVDDKFFNRLNDNRLSDEDIVLLERNGQQHLPNWPRYTELVRESVGRHIGSDKYRPYRYSAEPRIRWELLDPELADKCEELARIDLGSALSKAFLLLQSRLVNKFRVPDDSNPVDLVNKIFSDKGTLALNTSNNERKEILAMRDLLAGLFRVFRNKYSHKDVTVPWHETDAVLLLINFALKWIDHYQTEA